MFFNSSINNEEDSIHNGFYSQNEDGKFILGDFLERVEPYVHKNADMVDISSYNYGSNIKDHFYEICCTLGDVDNNGMINILDVIQILKKASDASYQMPAEVINTTNKIYGDIDQNNMVNDEDAALMLRLILENSADIPIS